MRPYSSYPLLPEEALCQEIEDVKWVKPEYGSGRVEAAGKVISARRAPDERMSMDDALSTAANWRSSHAYPLQVFSAILRNRAKRIDPNALVVQRLKRMPSIIAKLKRFDHMQLSQMQDLGGCRAIVDSLAEVNQLVALYESIPCDTAKFYKKYDYIAHPKEDGYRSVHLVYEYQSADDRRSIYNGSRIEIQIRSHLQHIWATAVETVDTFTRQSLKSGLGHASWKRFFSLMAAWISIGETKTHEPPIPGLEYSDRRGLVSEFHALCRELKVIEVLSHLAIATKQIHESSGTEMRGAEFHIFILNLNTDKTRILSFHGNDANIRVSEKYAELEAEYIKDPLTQLVLVSGESVSALRKAYPNYFHDTAEFVALVDDISGIWEGKRIKGRRSRLGA